MPSSSFIVADTARGHHYLKINGFSSLKNYPNGECRKSRPINVGGHRWRIKFYPNGYSPESTGNVSLFLSLDEDATERVRAKFQSGFTAEKRVLFFVKKTKPAVLASDVQNFASQSSWGYIKFIQWEDLEKLSHLKNDSFTIRCDIVVINGVCTDDTAKKAAPKFVSVTPSDLNQHLGDLLFTGKGADVVFEAGGETVRAHRCVLAARSSVFSAEIFGSMKESGTDDLVRTDDMEALVFKALLCFVYTDALPEMEKEEEDVMSQHLLVAADRYNMDRLKLVCEDKLCKYIDVGTAANILALTEAHHCQGLKSACFDFLTSQANLMAVMASDGFAHLSTTCPSVVKELFALRSAS